MPPQMPFGGGASAPMPIPGLGGLAAGQPLDGPPPSPTGMGGDPGSVAGPLSMRGLAPAVPSSQMPPEVLTGLTQAFSSVNDILSAAGQVAPNRQAQIALIQDMVQQLLADLMTDGAGPTAPTASGPAFPGGGLDRGIAGAGSV